MNCQAKIQDDLGNHYKCGQEAIIRVTIEQHVPHLGRIVKHSKCLCQMHRGRYVGRYKYANKHLHKNCTILETSI